MNSFRPPIGFLIWLTLFGYQTAVAALSRRKRSHHPNHAASYVKKEFISQLPDDILISIIGGLPTKEAVRTSILSNRWMNLYKFVPDIIFLCDYLVGPSASHPHDDPNTIINGVDRFLRLRSGFKIRSLYLNSCLTKLTTARYEQFIYSLGRLGIENLFHYCSCSLGFSDFAFSCHLLSQMPTLKYLHLGCCTLHQRPSLKHFDSGLCSLHKMHPLKLTQFNSLQVINLWYVTVLVGALDCILSNCLSLHSLVIYTCKFSSKLIIRGPSLQLKRLWIGSCEGIEEIELYASNLITFEFSSSEVVNFVFDHVPKLQSVFLDFGKQNTMSCVCTKFIKDVPHLKSLIFHTEGDIYQVSCKTMGFNTFSNLRQLSLRLYGTDNINLLSLAPFLQRCPILEEFHLDTEFVEYYRREVKKPEVVFHSELKKVEITGHSGTKNEVEFALYILKSAICLQQMHISRCPKWYSGWDRWDWRDEPSWSKKTREMIHRRLQGQAASKTARVTIQHSPCNENNWATFDAQSIISVFDGSIIM